jgi:hypothetical protein
MVIKSRRMRWAGIYHAYNILIEKLDGKKPLWRPMGRWKDNIEMSLIKRV